MDDSLMKKKGFIVALDQSGGSIPNVLANYGVEKEKYSDSALMFKEVYKMHKRIITNKAFTSDKILGTILFYDELGEKVNDLYVCDYLHSKNILSFLKIDLGLEDKQNGVAVMKEITNIDDILKEACEKNIYGTKMRSVIYEDNREGIKKLLQQQFLYAKKIYSYGLIPIIEPEVSINAINKENCEKILKEEMNKEISSLDDDFKLILKLTLPEIDNYYYDYTLNEKVLRVVALSGGYSKEEACRRLAKNKGMIASFSRALLEGLNISMNDLDFDKQLAENIEKTYLSSIN